MRNILKVAGLLAVGVVTVAASNYRPEVSAWNVDGAHSAISFSVRHFFTPVKGTFSDYEIDLNFDAENPENSTFEIKIAVASVNTGVEKRDNHLRSADWFETDKYPYMTFKSTSVKRVGTNEFLAVGDLTIKDVTKQVEFPITVLGIKDIPEPMQDMLGGVKRVASFESGSEIDRRDFDVGVGTWAETMIVGSDVAIEIVVEANLK
jgi:polyisoprenoid-binding protein YceI